MKKLIFIIPNIYSKGGLAGVTIQMMNELSKLDMYDITALSLSNENTETIVKLDEKIKRIDLPIPKFNIRKHTIKASQLLKKVVPKDFDGTIIVDDIGHTIPIYLGLHSRKKAKFIVWTHTNFFNGSKYGFSGVGKIVATKYFDTLIALTKEDEGYYKNIDKRQIVTQIYNPLNSKVIKKPYQQNSKKIISCGRLDNGKGFDMLVEVAKIVFEKHPDWRWDIYGEGPERENLQNKINEYKLQNNLYLMGFTNNILNLYGDYSFDVFTSRGEGCPLVLIEAQSAGLPVVSFDFKCGPKDMIDDNVNGFIINDFNIKEMAEKICLLIENPKMRCEFSKNADKNLDEFNMEYVIEKWKKIL